jgi:hypothetical protein
MLDDFLMTVVYGAKSFYLRSCKIFDLWFTRHNENMSSVRVSKVIKKVMYLNGLTKNLLVNRPPFYPSVGFRKTEIGEKFIRIYPP